MEKVNSTVFVLLLFLCGAYSVDIEDKIYKKLPSSAACFLKLNGTHQIGCTSKRGGNIGVVYVAREQEDVEWLIHKGTQAPYVAVLTPSLFNRDNLLRLKSSNKLSGMVLTQNDTDTVPEYFSHEEQCPNRESSLYAQQGTPEEYTCEANQWNSNGTGLLFENWGFPIFYMHTDDSVATITECYEKFNQPFLHDEGKRSQCAIQLSSNMLAALNTDTCLRRSNMITNFSPVHMCDPLGDRNILSTLVPYNESKPDAANRSVIIIASRMDTVSFFDQYVPGAYTPVSGMVVLLAVANALHEMNLDAANLTVGNVLFALFSGETYDYIGSSRMVYDMQKGTAPPVFNVTNIEGNSVPQPLQLGHVKMFVEFDQLAAEDGQYYVHMDPLSSGSAKKTSEDFYSALTSEEKILGLKFSSNKAEKPIPPASLQSFLKVDREIPGVVVTNYARAFKNKHYHSIYDSGKQLNYTYMNGSTENMPKLQTQLTNLATAIAQTVYKMAVKNASENVTVNATLIDELLHCYLETSDCSVFQAATDNVGLKAIPAPLYVGISNHATPAVDLTHNALAYLTGQKVNLTKEKCHAKSAMDVYQYVWMQGPDVNSTGMCVQSTVNFTEAMSPAFLPELVTDFDWSSHNYSTWTESRWQEFSARIFLKPSRQQEIITISVGTTILCIAFIVVYFLNARASVVFENRMMGAVC